MGDAARLKALGPFSVFQGDNGLEFKVVGKDVSAKLTFANNVDYQTSYDVAREISLAINAAVDREK